MKKFFGLVVWVVLSVSACAAPTPPADISGIQTQAAQTVIAGFVTPTSLAIPTLACDPRPFLQSSEAAIDQFKDVSTRAGVTSRIALSPVVGEMQEIRRDYKALIAPACAEKLHLLVGQAMDAEIESYLSFMKQDSDALVQSKMKIAVEAWAAALNEKIEVNTVLGTPRPPTARPPPTLFVAPTPKPSITPIPPLVMAVHDVSRANIYKGESAKTGQVFLLFSITVINNEGDDLSILLKDLYVTGNAGKAYALLGEGALSIAPKGRSDVSTAVQLPEDETGFFLVYDKVGDQSDALRTRFP